MNGKLLQYKNKTLGHTNDQFQGGNGDSALCRAISHHPVVDSFFETAWPIIFYFLLNEPFHKACISPGFISDLLPRISSLAIFH